MRSSLALLWLSLVVLLAVPIPSSAQQYPYPGYPMFSTQLGSKIDQIDIADGNISLALPMHSISSGPLPLDYTLFAASNAYWYNFGNGLTWYVTDPIFSLTQNYSARVAMTVDPEFETCNGNLDTLYSNFVVVDQYGASHPVNISPFDSQGCYTFIAGTYPAEDGSGYTVVLSGTYSSWATTLYDKSGNKYTSASTSSVVTPDNVTAQSVAGAGTGTYIKNSSGATVAQTQITYSNTGHPTTTTKSTSGSASLTSSATYNTNGTVATATDVNGTVSTPSYNGTDGCNGLLATSVTVTGSNLPSAGLTNSTQWNCNGGVVTQTADPNGQATNYTYNDPLWRITAITDPLQNVTTYSYPSQTTLESVMNLGATSTSDTLVTTDGLGEPIINQKRQAQGSSKFDSIQTTYGWTTGIGAFTTVSMPYSGTAGQPAPTGTAVTKTQNEAIGRTLTITDGGGGTKTYQYIQNDVLLSLGPTPQTFQKQLQYNGMGQLTSVCEITSVSGSGSCGQTNSEAGFLTKYTDNPAGVPLTSLQNAQPGAVGGTQQRTYAYDNPNRLTSETNPESATTTYTYDSIAANYCATGAYNSAGDLVAKANANGTHLCYYYDGLHRLTDVGNNAQSATNVCKRFRYDNASNGVASQPSGSSITYVAGRTVEAETDNCNAGGPITDEWFSYDKDGNIIDMWELTPHSGTYYHSHATVAANGVPVTVQLANPSLYTETYSLDGEGRPATLVSGTEAIVSGTTFNAASQPTIIDLGTGTDQSDYTYDPNTGRVTNWKFQVGSTASETGALTWNPNSTLNQLVINDGFNSAGSQTCTFGTSSAAGYDNLGRLLSDNCGSTTEYQEMSNRYVVMSTDDLLRIAGDPKSLTTTAGEALAEELRKRGLDSPDAIAKYEHERDQQTMQSEEQAAAVRWSKRSRLQKLFDYLKEHPLAALLACVGFPALAFLIGYGMVTLRVGNGRILSSLVCLMLALGCACGVAAARSSARLPIRVLGFLAALSEMFYAFVFLFSATIGFR